MKSGTCQGLPAEVESGAHRRCVSDRRGEGARRYTSGEGGMIRLIWGERRGVVESMKR